MLTHEQNSAVKAVVDEIKAVFNETVVPRLLADRIGDVGEETLRLIKAGKCIDTRIPRFLAVSGKGGPGHEGFVNVTNFDHSTSVAMIGANLCAIDLTADEVDAGTVRRAAAVAFAVAFLHDVDKLAAVGWRDADADLVDEFFRRYSIDIFLEHFGVRLTGAQMAALIEYDETRTSHRHGAACVPHVWVDIVRRYVRLADKLDSIWLSDLPNRSAAKAMGAWRDALMTSGLFLAPKAFSEYRVLNVVDPHHPFLMQLFFACLEEKCVEMTGGVPLFHVIRDETLVSLLPADAYDEIVDAAAEETAAGLPFESILLVSPAGVPKIGGSKPTWRKLGSLVREAVPSGDARRLLAVKVADLRTHEAEFRELAARAGCPFADVPKKITGQTLPIIVSPKDDDPAFGAVAQACLISLAVGVEEVSKNKVVTRKAREEALAKALDGRGPAWIGGLDALSRRTALALLTVAEMAADAGLAEALLGRHGLLPGWFGDDGVFSAMEDKAGEVRAAVSARFKALACGLLMEATPSAGGKHCLITSEPVLSDEIDSKDSLYGINSSAFSYREGRDEHKFSETKGTHLSPVSYGEYRMRGAAFRKLSRPKGEIPVRLSSPTAGGMASLAIGDMSDRGEYGLFDIVRADRSKTVYEGFESFTRRTVLGRFETLPKHMSDRRDGKSTAPGRISFVKVAMEAALRYGRPIHIFSGLPHPRREFFYCDCLDPEIHMLLGSDGFRIEEVPEAIDKLEILGAIAGPKKNRGLGMVDVAKQFCVPSSRFFAACLAWAVAKDTQDGAPWLVARLTDFIRKEVFNMDKQGNTAVIVRLGRLAAAVQRCPRRDDGANDEAFMFRTAVDAATAAWRSGVNDMEGLVSFVAGRINDDGERRQNGAKGFYAARENRREGQTISDAIEAFARCFVEGVWFGAFKGRPPSTAAMRNHVAAYRWSFSRGVPETSAEKAA